MNYIILALMVINLVLTIWNACSKQSIVSKITSISTIPQDSKAILISFNFKVDTEKAFRFSKVLEKEAGVKVIPLPFGVTAVTRTKP